MIPTIVKLNREQVEAVFSDLTKSAADCCVAMYKMAYSNWDEIHSIGVDGQNWPTVNKETGDKIMGMAIKHDRQVALLHRKDGDPLFSMYWYNMDTLRIMNGGTWINNGFSTDREDKLGLRDWNCLQAPVVLKSEKVTVYDKE